MLFAAASAMAAVAASSDALDQAFVGLWPNHQLCPLALRASGQSNPFHVLGLPGTASHDEVKASFRRLAKLYHPDVPGTGDEARFLAARTASEELSTSQGRTRWALILNQKTQERYMADKSTQERYWADKSAQERYRADKSRSAAHAAEVRSAKIKQAKAQKARTNSYESQRQRWREQLCFNPNGGESE